MPVTNFSLLFLLWKVFLNTWNLEIVSWMLSELKSIFADLENSCHIFDKQIYNQEPNLRFKEKMPHRMNTPFVERVSWRCALCGWSFAIWDTRLHIVPGRFHPNRWISSPGRHRSRDLQRVRSQISHLLLRRSSHSLYCQQTADKFTWKSVTSDIGHNSSTLKQRLTLRPWKAIWSFPAVFR